VDIGAHDGHESSQRIDSWGEPDNMRRLEVLPGDTYVPGNLYGEVWEVTWTRKHIWRHYYVVSYACKKTRDISYTDSEGKSATRTESYWSTCYRTEHNEMTAIDTRVDKVSITLKAKENSKTSISLDYEGAILSTRNDVVKAFTSRDVTYTSDHTDSGLKEAYDSYNPSSSVSHLNLTFSVCK